MPPTSKPAQHAETQRHGHVRLSRDEGQRHRKPARRFQPPRTNQEPGYPAHPTNPSSASSQLITISTITSALQSPNPPTISSHVRSQKQIRAHGPHARARHTRAFTHTTVEERCRAAPIIDVGEDLTARRCPASHVACIDARESLSRFDSGMNGEFASKK